MITARINQAAARMARLVEANGAQVQPFVEAFRQSRG
jgi:hypothetical protein